MMAEGVDWSLDTFYIIIVVVLANSKGLLKPPLWDESGKEFSLWIQKFKPWKNTTQDRPALKNLHDKQIASNLPEGIEIRTCA